VGTVVTATAFGSFVIVTDTVAFAVTTNTGGDEVGGPPSTL
jgi:hypothetical protein